METSFSLKLVAPRKIHFLKYFQKVFLSLLKDDEWQWYYSFHFVILVESILTLNFCLEPASFKEEVISEESGFSEVAMEANWLRLLT